MNRISRSGGMRIVLLVAAMAFIHAATLRASEVISNVTAKAQYENTGFWRYARNAVNGVGLHGDAHTNAASDYTLNVGYMWQGGTYPAWFRVNLDRECYVETIRVWNYNEGGQWPKRGVQIADIYTAVDPGASAVGGAGWELLEADHVFPQAPGLNTYNTPEVLTVNRTALYIGFNVKTNFSTPTDKNIGLSEVQVIGRPAITLLVSNVTATASTSDSVNQLPIRAIDQSGFAGKSHDNISTNMWMSSVGAPGWYKVDLGKAYTLRRIDVWNYNQLGWINRGVGTANIYTAMTNPGTAPGGAGWTLVKAGQYFTAGTAANGYDTPTRVILEQRARYVGFEILTAQTGGTRVGFSELQFHASPPSGTFIFIR